MSRNNNIGIVSGSGQHTTRKMTEDAVVYVAKSGSRRRRKAITSMIWSSYDSWRYNSSIYCTWQGTKGYCCGSLPSPWWRSFWNYRTLLLCPFLDPSRIHDVRGSNVPPSMYLSEGTFLLNLDINSSYVSALIVSVNNSTKRGWEGGVE